MKFILAICLSVGMGLLGCSFPTNITNDLDKPSGISAGPPLELRDPSINRVTTVDPKEFEVSFGGLILKAHVDETGQALINYPSEWVGKVALVRFDGQTGIVSPFSMDHCEEIRKSAASGFGNLLVRSGYHSLLIFDTPPFLSSDFMSVVENPAQAGGLRLEFPTLKNPVDRNGSIEVALSNKAISQLLGNTSIFREQFNISKEGLDDSPSHTKLNITAGDIICDLISGDAKLTITYPITNSDRVIKVIYDSLAVKLELKK